LYNFERILPENRYKKHSSELRKGFTDLTSDLVHITLFGMHANKARILQVQNALTNYQEFIHKHNMNGVFDIELKGLGSWTTQSGCVCLYADLTKESAVKIKTLAKEMRDFVNTSLVDNIENIHLIELKNHNFKLIKMNLFLIMKKMIILLTMISIFQRIIIEKFISMKITQKKTRI